MPLIKLNREKQQQLQLMEDLLITQLVGAGKARGGPMSPMPVPGKAASQGPIRVLHPQHTA